MWQYQSSVVNWLILSHVLFTNSSKRSLPGLYDMTNRERQKGELLTLWLVDYMKGAQKSKASIIGLPGIQLTTHKEMVRCPVNYPPVSHFWCTRLLPLVLCELQCVSGLKILQCSLQDQWIWPISCGLLHRTASDSSSSCSLGHHALVVGKSNENWEDLKEKGELHTSRHDFRRKREKTERLW